MFLHAHDHWTVISPAIVVHGSFVYILHSPVVTRGEIISWCVCVLHPAWLAGPDFLQVIPCSDAYLASADSHEESALAPLDGGVVVLHDCVKGLTSALGLTDHLLQGCQLAP